MKISICSFLNQYIYIYISSWNSITNFTIAPRVYLMRLWGNFSAVSGLIDNFSSRLLSLVQLKRRRKIFFITLDKESASFLNLICEPYLWTVFATTLPVLFKKNFCDIHQINTSQESTGFLNLICELYSPIQIRFRKPTDIHRINTVHK